MNSGIKTTILGCGSSGGVPRIDGDWGVCDPNNVKNIRSRCSILVEKITNDKKTVVLIDTSRIFLLYQHLQEILPCTYNKYGQKQSVVR